MKKIKSLSELRTIRNLDYANSSESSEGIIKRLLEKYKPKESFNMIKHKESVHVLEDVA